MARPRKTTVEKPATPPKIEIATIARDLIVTAFGDVLSPQDETLATRGGGLGLRIYERLLRDPRVRTVINARKFAVTSREWGVTPASDRPVDRQASELVEKWLKRINFDKCTRGLLHAVLMGFAVGEVMWTVDDGEIGPTAVLPRAARRFCFSISSELRLLTREAPLLGEQLPPRKFIVYRHGDDETDDPYGLGLGSVLFWPVLFKRSDIQYWLRYLEKFGGPTVVGKYPQGSPSTEVDKLQAALRSILTAAVVSIPDTMKAELMEAQRGGNGGDGYEKLARYMDEAIAEIVLGQSLTTAAGERGSRALGQVHDDVRMALAKADGDEVCETLNATLVKWIVELNLPGAEPPQVYRDFSEPEDLAQAATRDATLSGIGIKLTQERVDQTYGSGYVLERQPPPTGEPPADFSEPGDKPPVQQRLADKLAPELGPETDNLVDAARELLGKSNSLAEFAEGLASLASDKRQTRMAVKLRSAMVLADLYGRDEVNSEIAGDK